MCACQRVFTSLFLDSLMAFCLVPHRVDETDNVPPPAPPKETDAKTQLWQTLATEQIYKTGVCDLTLRDSTRLSRCRARLLQPCLVSSSWLCSSVSPCWMWFSSSSARENPARNSHTIPWTWTQHIKDCQRTISYQFNILELRIARNFHFLCNFHDFFRPSNHK